MKNTLLIILAILLISSCTEVSQKQREHVDSLNQVAYAIRYSDIDSTRHLSERAFRESEAYPDGKARALNMLVYVDYQQMDFSSAFAKLDSVSQLTSNQIILLVSDVLGMKINQRIGDGTAYFESRNRAMKRLARAQEEYDLLSANDRRDFFFARTEYHIISSTYCYYQDQEQQAIDEMAAIAEDFAQIPTDTTQWLYYNYMMGSGGLITGTPEDVAVREFDHLMKCWGFSRNMAVTYFEANSLQALASLLSNPQARKPIKEKNGDLYQLLINQHTEWLPGDTLDNESHLSEALALHAVYAFRQYKDLFQTACAYRTMGEMDFKHGHYEEALYNYSMALDCVNEQYLFNHGNQADRLLSLYDETGEGGADIELEWIDSDSIYTVPEWIAGIRQQISMTYSALGMKAESDFNRNIYLDIIARTSQNVEMESRMMELRREADSLRLRLIVTALLFMALVILIIAYSYRIHKSNSLKLNQRQSGTDTTDSLEADARHLEQLQDELEEVREHIGLCTLKLDTGKRRNAEKRAKVSLVHAVTPFLDRILNQVDRMNRDGQVDGDKLDYVLELTDRIVTYNELLTEWIKMEKGELSLQVSTIHLSRIFDTLSRGHYAFDMKGVRLNVIPTQLSVKADEALTLFMLNTLADNARKFTPEGGTVTVEAQDCDDYVELSVTDTGCGMSAEDVDTLNNSKVYDSRKIGSGHEGKGFGFGIMNCRGIIEKYRKTSAIFNVCHFGVESQLGQGSRFYFRLPRVTTILVAILITHLSYAQPTAQVEEPLQETAQTDSTARYSSVLFDYNDKGDYPGVLSAGRLMLQQIHPLLCLTREEEMARESATNEVELFLQGEQHDYLEAINIRNEIARAALAMGEWDIYRYNNNLCTSLYKLYHQDQDLPTYCEKLERTQSTSRQLLVLLVTFSLFVILLALAMLRRRMFLDNGLKLQQQLSHQLEEQDATLTPTDLTELQQIAQRLLHTVFEGMKNWQDVSGLTLQVNRTDGQPLFSLTEGEEKEEVHQIPLGEEGLLTIFGHVGKSDEHLNQLTSKTLQNVLVSRVIRIAGEIEQLEQHRDHLNHLTFEERRLHVQNQVLDNCLSTIKHESMYYPSRIHQLASRLKTTLTHTPETETTPADTADLLQLTELAHYYKEVYTLLSSQADKLAQQICYRKERLDLAQALQKAARHYHRVAHKKGLGQELTVTTPADISVHADTVLLEELFVLFNTTFIAWYQDADSQGKPVPSEIQLHAGKNDGIVQLRYHLPGIQLSDSQAHNLFYPESHHVNLLIAKQIVREIDALNNFPGLRLIAESHEGGAEIVVTLR